MALAAGIQGVFAPVNVAGVLLRKTPVDTPLFNRMGVRVVQSREFLVGSEYELNAAGDPISEDASVTAPAPKYVQPAQIKNVTQIQHEAVRSTYRKQSDTDTLTGLNLAGLRNNVSNPLAFAIDAQMDSIRKSMESTIINGEYNLAANSAQVDTTRGLNEAITTNVVLAGGAELGWDMLVEVARDIASISPYKLNGVVGVLNPEQVVQLQKLVTEQGLKITYREAGANLYTIQTPFGLLDFVEGGHGDQTNGTAGFYRLPSCNKVFQPVPEKGAVFYEGLAKTGATEHGQIYAQWGLDHGHEWLHGKITGLATTTTPTTAFKVKLVGDDEEIS